MFYLCQHSLSFYSFSSYDDVLLLYDDPTRTKLSLHLFLDQPPQQRARQTLSGICIFANYISKFVRLLFHDNLQLSLLFFELFFASLCKNSLFFRIFTNDKYDITRKTYVNLCTSIHIASLYSFSCLVEVILP